MKIINDQLKFTSPKKKKKTVMTHHVNQKIGQIKCNGDRSDKI